jgi:glycosyltransferase involved in cell wall biosynthesis
MKIAMIVSTFYPKVGGMGSVVFDEATRLVALGHVVTVFTMKYPGLADEEKVEGINIQRIKSPVRCGDGGFVFGFPEKVKDFDLFHFHFPWFGVELALLKLKKSRLVITYHMDATPASFIKRLLVWLSDWLFAKKMFDQAEKVIVVDKDYFLHSKFKNVIPESKIVEIGNAVEIPEVLPTRQFNKEKYSLLFVGNLLPLKRLDLLLSAMEELKDKVKLTVVGGGYEEEKYKAMVADKKLTDAVEFVSYGFTKEKLTEYFQVADCVVVPSDKESFSLVAVMAMANGTPVVASNIPGLRKRIIDGVDGFLFTSGDKKDLVEKINKCLTLGEREKGELIKKACAKVKEKYSWDNHMKKLLAVYGREN